MNYTRFLTQLSKNRKPSITREMTKLLAKSSSDVIPLSTGMPNPAMFPVTEVSFKIADGTQIHLKGERMKSALQYLPTNGHGGLINRLRDLQTNVHNLDDNYWSTSDLIVTNGSQDGLCKTCEFLMHMGCSVVTEEYIFSGTLAVTNPYKPKYITVANDSEGMRPDKLHEALASRWRPEDMDTAADAPKFMIINPTGSNPCGTVLTADRRREIYQICSEYNLLILEDDPYYYMQFEGDGVPSFLSLDTDGRVIRFDSFSKILSSGVRLGFATGPKPLIDRLLLHAQVSTMHASSLSQVLTNELFGAWGHEGFHKHLDSVRNFYHKRRDIMVSMAEKHLTGLCEWNVPAGGMFLWIKVKDMPDTWDMIMDRALAKNILLIPGKAFQPDQDRGSSYMRAAFTLASEEEVDVAFQRLAELIREELQRLQPMHERTIA